MATLILSTLGSMAGPLGGALGALAGQQLDRALIGSPRREGPRLKELAVTTSTYGAPIPRQHGLLRSAGTIIWATELAESSATSGGKSGPAITTYAYSASFAVALSCRPIREIGRIWADGNLLRGAAGDLKVGGIMRLYRGYGDQPVDPLIASDIGPACPAFRHIAYVVFEDLQLADFGNRIPALTFEIVADDGEVTLAQLLEPLDEPFTGHRDLAGLQGFSLEGGRMAEMLAVLDTVWPMALDTSGRALAIRAADGLPDTPPLLPPPAAAPDGEGFARAGGVRHMRGGASGPVPDALRYYDAQRDFLPGMQRAEGRARPGEGMTIDLPGTLSAADARALVNAAAQRQSWGQESLAWRLADLDPALAPGVVVRAPTFPGLWRIEGWEWSEEGVTLELRRLPRGPARQPRADPGSALPAPDVVATATLLECFELPWDGTGTGDRPAIHAAPSSAGAGWRGAALHAERDGVLAPLGGTGARRCVIGHSAGPVPPSPAMLLERGASIDVMLASADFALTSTTPEALANGANRALLGGEVIQFAAATALGGGTWRLAGLLRGRGGTEDAAQAGHPAGTVFVLLDGTARLLDPVKVGPSQGTLILAQGLADAEPVSAPIANPGLSLRPLAPVHPRVQRPGDGGLTLGWTRRARGAWGWADEVDVPLAEQMEAYRVGLGPTDAPLAAWDVSAPALTLSAGTLAPLRAAHPGAPFWVRQVGSFAQSHPLFLTTLS
ncbi:phage tail protein [Altererythrobacter fulvus]|uniref:GTA baseplate fiber-binding domain-containing protein n=1 Tax=Caenibius fulvus TaxID=2126012 RepID=UPI0030176416